MNVFISYQPPTAGSTNTSFTDAYTRAYGQKPTGRPQRLDRDVYVFPGTVYIERHAPGCQQAPAVQPPPPAPNFWTWISGLFD